MGALVPTGPLLFLYSLRFIISTSKTTAMGTRQRVVPSQSSSQRACGYPWQKRVFGRAGEIREELHEQASALTQRRAPQKAAVGEHDQQHPRQGHGSFALLARKLLKGFSPRAAPWVSESG